MCSILLDMQEYEKSLDHLKEAVNLDSSNVIYYNKSIKAYSMNEQYNEALVWLNKLAQIDSSNFIERS
jgi:tetratricopeptide (TPR) repeat protein